MSLFGNCERAVVGKATHMPNIFSIHIALGAMAVGIPQAQG